MIYEIPTKDSKLWIQPNKGDRFGNLFGTWNMDFDSSVGKVRVSKRTLIRTDDTDDADLGLPLAFVRTAADSTDRWWALCGTKLFKNTAGASPASSAFVQDAIADSPTTTIVSSDMVEFNGSLIVSLSTDLAKLTAGTWDAVWWDTTLAQAALTTGIAHPLHVALKNNILMIGNGNVLHTVDKNNNVRASRVILPTEFEITWIRSTYDGTWIGARNKLMREGKAFFWDESAENFNRAYGVKSDISFAGVIKNGVPYIVNGEGQLLKFTGVGFEEVAVFPCFSKNNVKLNDGQTPRGSIHRNGMAVIDEHIHINLNSYINATNTTSSEEFPAGIWTYDEKQGLRHKYGLSMYRAASGSEKDYGAFTFIGGLSGALAPTETGKGVFLAGAKYSKTVSDTLTGIWVASETESLNNRGYFITSIFESSAFEDVYKDILSTFKRFKNSGDRIVIKYRTMKSTTLPLRLSGEWTDTNTFTVDSATFSSVAVGDEIQIVGGTGSGATAHISALSNVGTVYTVDLDETITGATGTFFFLANSWLKAAVISTQAIERQSFDLDAVGTFMQLKIELRSVPAGTSNKADSPELEQIVVTSDKENTI